jgi:hypothetical protein
MNSAQDPAAANGLSNGPTFYSSELRADKLDVIFG